MSSSFDCDEEAGVSTVIDYEKVCIDSLNGAVFHEKEASDHPGYLTTYGFASPADRDLYEKQYFGFMHFLLMQVPRYIGGLLRQFQRLCCLPDSRPVLHMYWIHPKTGAMEIAGESGDLKNRQYKIVTIHVNFPKALDYEYGVIAIVPVKRWWQWWRRSTDALPVLNISEKPAQPVHEAPVVETVVWNLPPPPSQEALRLQSSKLGPKRVKLNKAASSPKE